MNTEKYQEFVKIGNFTEGHRDGKFLAALGLSGEAAEIAELVLAGDRAAIELCIKTGAVSERVKKHLLHKKDLDRDALMKELGDVFWYLAHACNAFGFTLNEVMEANVVKLCDRHSHYGDPEDWLGGGARHRNRADRADGGQAAGGFLDMANELTS